MKTIAIYGAGPALGMAAARRFGREGFRVALVARSRERLDGMVRELAADGVEAAGFPADISDQRAALRAADQIEAQFGAIDVLEHSPTPGRAPGRLFTGPLELDTATIAPLLDLYLLTPVALVGRVLPGMRERGRGGLLFAMGAAARYPIPQLAAGGIALSGLRSYVHTLNSALRETGVYAGALLIGAVIEDSRTHRSAGAPAVGSRPQALVPAGDLADHLWDLYAKRDRVEDLVAPGLAVAGQ
ncbi:MAG TPA: SDR family NAD(P)-dependent oxidoreductase [Trebonia sp.]|jgi:short-subunit dehydrogenase|nr:SDR family NAD(P)-dependent oxidoreductase [Trebonia sp.]